MGYIIKFILGTCKIDKNCTCTIKLIERENGTFVSEIYQKYYGHESEFGHMFDNINKTANCCKVTLRYF